MQGGDATSNMNQTYLDVVAFGHSTKILSEKCTEPKIESSCTRTVELLDSPSRGIFQIPSTEIFESKQIEQVLI